MVVLSAQDFDVHINKLAPALFKSFSNIEPLAKVKKEDLELFIGKVRGFGKKSYWLSGIAHKLKDEDNIITTIKELTAIKGVGRKSANLIMSEAEGIKVELHLKCVVPRLGISKVKDGVKWKRN